MQHAVQIDGMGAKPEIGERTLFCFVHRFIRAEGFGNKQSMQQHHTTQLPSPFRAGSAVSVATLFISSAADTNHQ